MLGWKIWQGIFWIQWVITRELYSLHTLQWYWEWSLGQKSYYMKANPTWRSSPVQSLVVSTVDPLGKVFIFSVKHTMYGTLFILLGNCFGRPVRVKWWHIDFITMSYRWGRQQWISSHDMGCLLSELLIIVSMGKLMMSFYGNVCCSTLTISILMKYISFWSLYLKSV